MTAGDNHAATGEILDCKRGKYFNQREKNDLYYLISQDET